MIQTTLENPKRALRTLGAVLRRGLKARLPPPYARPATSLSPILWLAQAAVTDWGGEQFLYYKCKKRARSTINLLISVNYQSRDKRNVIYKAFVSKTKESVTLCAKGSATLTMPYAIKLILLQELEKNEITRGREKQRNANKERREQLRTESARCIEVPGIAST